ncbi:MAG: purine-nucleoside phosphorylase [Woeseiaceae bacterium]
MLNDIKTAVAKIREHSDLQPSICLVLGSGLGHLADEIDGVRIPYDSIPGFPVSTAPSHAGQLVLGLWHGCPVVAMQGRVHLYEGYTPQAVTFPMRVMAALGAKTAVLTNAAGGLSPGQSVGDLVVIEDHLSLANLAGSDPLRGAHDQRVGSRFLSLNNAYDRDLVTLAKTTASNIGQTLTTGVYGFATGPSFETPAEVRFLQSMGCDLVGMSTVPEVIVARHMGLTVLAISAITNLSIASVNDSGETTESEVFEAAEIIRPKLSALIAALVPAMAANT